MVTDRNFCKRRIRYLVTKNTNASGIQLIFVDDRVVNREILCFGVTKYFKTYPIMLFNPVITFSIDIYEDLYKFYL